MHVSAFDDFAEVFDEETHAGRGSSSSVNVCLSQGLAIKHGFVSGLGLAFLEDAENPKNRRGCMYGQSGKLAHMGRLLMSGCGIRETARKVGAGKNTVKKFYKRLLAEREQRGLGPLRCACGGPVGHQGWCRVRMQRSPARQAVMARLHEAQRTRSRIPSEPVAS